MDTTSSHTGRQLGHPDLSGLLIVRWFFPTPQTTPDQTLRQAFSTGKIQKGWTLFRSLSVWNVLFLEQRKSYFMGKWSKSKAISSVRMCSIRLCELTLYFLWDNRLSEGWSWSSFVHHYLCYADISQCTVNLLIGVFMDLCIWFSYFFCWFFDSAFWNPKLVCVANL